MPLAQSSSQSISQNEFEQKPSVPTLDQHVTFLIAFVQKYRVVYENDRNYHVAIRTALSAFRLLQEPGARSDLLESPETLMRMLRLATYALRRVDRPEVPTLAAMLLSRITTDPSSVEAICAAPDLLDAVFGVLCGVLMAGLALQSDALAITPVYPVLPTDDALLKELEAVSPGPSMELLALDALYQLLTRPAGQRAFIKHGVDRWLIKHIQAAAAVHCVSHPVPAPPPTLATYLVLARIMATFEQLTVGVVFRRMLSRYRAAGDSGLQVVAFVLDIYALVSGDGDVTYRGGPLPPVEVAPVSTAIRRAAVATLINLSAASPDACRQVAGSGLLAEFTSLIRTLAGATHANTTTHPLGSQTLDVLDTNAEDRARDLFPGLALFANVVISDPPAARSIAHLDSTLTQLYESESESVAGIRSLVGLILIALLPHTTAVPSPALIADLEATLEEAAPELQQASPGADVVDRLAAILADVDEARSAGPVESTVMASQSQCSATPLDDMIGDRVVFGGVAIRVAERARMSVQQLKEYYGTR